MRQVAGSGRSSQGETESVPCDRCIYRSPGPAQESGGLSKGFIARQAHICRSLD